MAVGAEVRDWIKDDLVLHGLEVEVHDWMEDDLVLCGCRGGDL